MKCEHRRLTKNNSTETTKYKDAGPREDDNLLYRAVVCSYNIY